MVYGVTLAGSFLAAVTFDMRSADSVAQYLLMLFPLWAVVNFGFLPRGMGAKGLFSDGWYGVLFRVLGSLACIIVAGFNPGFAALRLGGGLGYGQVALLGAPLFVPTLLLLMKPGRYLKPRKDTDED